MSRLAPRLSRLETGIYLAFLWFTILGVAPLVARRVRAEPLLIRWRVHQASSALTVEPAGGRPML